MTIADVTVPPSGLDIDFFPSKEPSVERPRSRSEECQCRPNTCQQSTRRQIFMLRKGVPQAKDDYQRPCDGRPQSSNQERAISDHEYVENRVCNRLTGVDVPDPMGNESDTGHQSQEHECRTGQSAGKCGE
jgi:hypothetical protein